MKRRQVVIALALLSGAMLQVPLVAAPAQAVPRCSSTGGTTSVSGQFWNAAGSGTSIEVTGDAYYSGAFHTMTVYVDPGFTAYQWSRICDADFFRPGVSFKIRNSYGQDTNYASNTRIKIGIKHYKCWKDNVVHSLVCQEGLF